MTLHFVLKHKMLTEISQVMLENMVISCSAAVIEVNSLTLYSHCLIMSFEMEAFSLVSIVSDFFGPPNIFQ